MITASPTTVGETKTHPCVSKRHSGSSASAANGSRRAAIRTSLRMRRLSLAGRPSSEGNPSPARARILNHHDHPSARPGRLAAPRRDARVCACGDYRLRAGLHRKAIHPPPARVSLIIMTTLPPGRDGLPLLGETLDFAKTPFGFIKNRLAPNVARVFRSRVLGRQPAVIAGADAAGRFIDPNAVVREGSMPPHVQELFGGRSLPLLDGEVHAARKREVLKAFGRDALASYLPLIEKTTQDYFARWAKEPEIGWIDELKKLSIEVICAAIIGLPRGNGMDQLRRDYIILLNGFATLPIHLPGTRYRKALQARDRILDALRQAVRERRRVSTNDGLSRILASGALSDEEAALELHHIAIAGFIVWAELASMVHQLTLHPDVRERLAREVQAADSYSSMPYLLQVVNEVKRLCSIVPVVFGKTKEPMPIDDVTVPAGWMGLFALVPSHR